MTLFSYEAVDRAGASLAGEIEADSAELAVSRLQERGLYPVSVEKRSRNAGRTLKLQRAGLTWRKETEFLTAQLATLLDAGLALDDALGALERMQRKPALKRLVQQLLSEVQAGRPLSEALARSEGAFSPFYINMVKAGEASGTLSEALARLAAHLERSREVINGILSALAYPAVLVIVAGASLLVLLTFVVPRFKPLFDDLGATLPWSTTVVISVAEGLQNYWWLGVLGIVGLPFAVRHWLSDPARKARTDELLLRLPILGTLFRSVETARFSRSIGILLSNGVPLLSALKIVQDSMGNLVMREAVGVIESSLSQGRGLAQPMAASERFPDLAVQLVRVGEESGALGAMLSKIADIYEQDVERGIKRLLTILEPVLILLMGVVVGGIIVSILLAVLGLNEIVA
jgi:general secretion pathway protein F